MGLVRRSLRLATRQGGIARDDTAVQRTILHRLPNDHCSVREARIASSNRPARTARAAAESIDICYLVNRWSVGRWRRWESICAVPRQRRGLPVLLRLRARSQLQRLGRADSIRPGRTSARISAIRFATAVAALESVWVSTTRNSASEYLKRTSPPRSTRFVAATISSIGTTLGAFTPSVLRVAKCGDFDPNYREMGLIGREVNLGGYEPLDPLAVRQAVCVILRSRAS